MVGIAYSIANRLFNIILSNPISIILSIASILLTGIGRTIDTSVNVSSTVLNHSVAVVDEFFATEIAYAIGR